MLDPCLSSESCGQLPGYQDKSSDDRSASVDSVARVSGLPHALHVLAVSLTLL